MIIVTRTEDGTYTVRVSGHGGIVTYRGLSADEVGIVIAGVLPKMMATATACPICRT